MAPNDHIVHDPAEQPRWGATVSAGSHGVFRIGADPRQAVTTAVVCEDAGRAVLLVRSLGHLDRLGATEIDSLHDRYQNADGQS